MRWYGRIAERPNFDLRMAACEAYSAPKPIVADPYFSGNKMLAGQKTNPPLSSVAGWRGWRIQRWGNH
jgi:hypothetical protein